jgi:hypothetical protein
MWCDHRIGLIWLKSRLISYVIRQLAGMGTVEPEPDDLSQILRLELRFSEKRKVTSPT